MENHKWPLLIRTGKNYSYLVQYLIKKLHAKMSLAFWKFLKNYQNQLEIWKNNYISIVHVYYVIENFRKSATKKIIDNPTSVTFFRIKYVKLKDLSYRLKQKLNPKVHAPEVILDCSSQTPRESECKEELRSN